MKIAPCPSCGAEVRFHAADSVLAVCEFCQTTLVRHDLVLSELGKMAQLADDATPLRLHMQGRYQGQSFTLIGRIQYRYAQGLWNEWYMLFDDGRCGWLSEASGLFTVTFAAHIKEVLPAFGLLRPELSVHLGGKSYTITDLETAECIAGAGELPFVVSGGQTARYADLQGPEQAFATFDYSEDPPQLYIGNSVALPELHLDGAAAAAVEPKSVAAQAWRCPSCATPFQVHSPQVNTVACANCGTVVDVKDPNLQILQHAYRQQPVSPRIPLGREGRLLEVKYTVIGWLERSSTGNSEFFSWEEYLLYSPEVGFRWLIESRGHWSLGQAVSAPPTVGPGMSSFFYLEHDYRPFEDYLAQVTHVAGEFYWRVSVGEQAAVSEFVAPPYLLSRERTENEVNWTRAEYVDAELIATAFKLSHLPQQLDIAANQPSPYASITPQVWVRFIVLALLLLVTQLFFAAFAANSLVQQVSLDVAPGVTGTSFTTPIFDLEGHTSNVAIINRSSVDNSWLWLDISLINQGNGQIRHIGRELDRYHGSDDDGDWNEGSGGDEAVLSAVAPGRYILQVNGEVEPGHSQDINDALDLRRDVPTWANFWLALGALSLYPLWVLWRRWRFEIRRWADSDHPLVNTD